MSKQIIITQNDTGISIVFNITENKKPYDLSNKQSYCNILSPDGQNIETELNILNTKNGQVELFVGKELTKIPGLYKIYIRVSDEANRITAQKLIPYFVLEDIGGDKNEV